MEGWESDRVATDHALPFFDTAGLVTAFLTAGFLETAAFVASLGEALALTETGLAAFATALAEVFAVALADFALAADLATGLAVALVDLAACASAPGFAFLPPNTESQPSE